jgi:hypothetical protein
MTDLEIQRLETKIAGLKKELEIQESVIEMAYEKKVEMAKMYLLKAKKWEERYASEVKALGEDKKKKSNKVKVQYGEAIRQKESQIEVLKRV